MNINSQTVCQPKHVVEDEETISRRKRQLDIKPETEAIKGDPNLKNRCHLALVADHRFYQEIGNGNGKLTVAYMVFTDSIFTDLISYRSIFG